MSGSAARLYDEDFVRWTEEQAQALRQAAGLAINLPLDWENDLGSRLAVILEHLIKLKTSPASDPRSGWMDTIDRERSTVERLLQQSPSLRGEVGRMILAETPRAARLAARSLLRHGETTAAAVVRLSGASYTEDQVLRDWFPCDAPRPDLLPENGQGDKEE